MSCWSCIEKLLTICVYVWGIEKCLSIFLQRRMKNCSRIFQTLCSLQDPGEDPISAKVASVTGAKREYGATAMVSKGLNGPME